MFNTEQPTIDNHQLSESIVYQNTLTSPSRWSKSSHCADRLNSRFNMHLFFFSLRLDWVSNIWIEWNKAQKNYDVAHKKCLHEEWNLKKH